MPATAWLTLVVAAVLAAVHLVVGRMSDAGDRPHGVWLSAAGGISVAYVFVHLLPRLAEIQQALGPRVHGAVGFLEHHAYLVALAGLTVFYGLERHALHVRQRRRGVGEPDVVSDLAGWLHLVPYALYNGIVGYLLAERMAPGPRELALFAFAMAVHFAVNDQILREHYGALYHEVGRFLVAAAILAGWGLSLVVRLSPSAIGLPLAFLAGGVVLNVLRAELPGEGSGSFWAFGTGAAAYAAVLLAA